MEWTVALSYGDDVEVARRTILDLFSADDRIVKQTLEQDRLDRIDEESRQHSNQETDEEVEAAPRKRSLLYRMFHRKHSDLKSRLESMRMEEETKIKAFTPTIDRRPTVALSELADSSINLTARAWVQSKDYWSVYYDFNERIYNELPRHGLSFPFPQMDVHITKE